MSGRLLRRWLDFAVRSRARWWRRSERVSPHAGMRMSRRNLTQNPEQLTTHMESRQKLSVDWWSVITAIGATVLIKFGILPHIPW